MRISSLFLLLMVLALPVSGFQGSQSDQWRQKELSELPGMSPIGSKYMLGTSEVKGVRSVAYLNDVQILMNKYGLKDTHHIMVSFKDSATGQMLTSGSVEIRVVGPEESRIEEKIMFGMEESFGTDIDLSRNGKYRFEIRALLHDGVERLFLYDFAH